MQYAVVNIEKGMLVNILPKKFMFRDWKKCPQSQYLQRFAGMHKIKRQYLVGEGIDIIPIN